MRFLVGFLLLGTTLAGQRTDLMCQGRDPNACVPNEFGDRYTCTYNFELTQRLSMEYNIVSGYTSSYPIFNAGANPDDNYADLFYTQCSTNMYTNNQDTCLGVNETFIERGDPAFLGVDGVRRRVSYINGNIPGPTICVGWRDTIVVHFTNAIGGYGFEDVTIHWHGMFQHGSPWMDGVGYVTQCPITPGQSFTYQFEANPAGTFWYHSHMGLQYGDGVFGALIIFDDVELHSNFYSTNVLDQVMVVNDWSHQYTEYNHLENPGHWVLDDGQVMNRTESVDGAYLSGQPFESALINGYGTFSDEFGDTMMEPYVFYVEPNFLVRFRLIAATSEEPFLVTIDDHVMWLIAMDGFDISEPFPMQGVIIFPAERYDFVIHTNKTVGDYRVRLETLNKDGPDTTYAILSYITTGQTPVEVANTTARAPPMPDTTSQLEDCTPGHECAVVNCPWPDYYTSNSNILCYVPGDFESHQQEYNVRETTPDFSNVPDSNIIYLNYNILGDTSLQRPNIDGIFLKLPPENPTTDPNWFDMPTACHLGDFGLGSFNPVGCTRWINLNYGEKYIFVLTNRWFVPGNNFPGIMAHPSHMHGHSFYILADNAGTINPLEKGNATMGCENGAGAPSDYCNDEETLDGDLVCSDDWGNCTFVNNELPLTRTGANAPRKDTLVLPPHGYVIIGVVADNPGWWIWHCHIEGHLAAGMGLLLNEANPELEEEVDRYLPADFPMCTNFENNPREQADNIRITIPGTFPLPLPLTPLFDPTISNYELNVTNDVSAVHVFATGIPTDGADAVINGVLPNPSDIALLVGENGVTIYVAVESEPSTSRTYNILINRLGAAYEPEVGEVCEFDAPQDGYLPGFACGDAKLYSSAEDAQEACCKCNDLGVCNGITCNTDGTACSIRAGLSFKNSGFGEHSYRIPRTPHDCTFGSPVADTFVLGYACGDGTRYILEDAEFECCNCAECTAVVVDAAGQATIRRGSSERPSPHGETTYMKG